MEQPRRSGDLHYLWWLALAAAIAVVLYLLSPILAPFLFAATLAYICNPLVDGLSRWKVSRTLGAVLVLVLLLAVFTVLLLVMLPLLLKQVRAIAEQMPVYVDWMRSTLGPLAERHLGIRLDVALVKEWLLEHVAEVRGVALKLLPSIKTGGLALLGFVVNLVLVPVVLFYFLRDWSTMVNAVDEIIPRRWHETAGTILREIDEVLGQFLRGQLMVMLLMGIFYAVGLWLAGLDFALSVGMIAGMVTFVPYLGVVIGMTLATLTGLLQFSEPAALFGVWAVFVVGNLLEGYVLVPRLVGERIGLHPVAVIFALLAFGQLFGFFGVLLALPASAALLVWLRHVRASYLASGAYQQQR